MAILNTSTPSKMYNCNITTLLITTIYFTQIDLHTCKYKHTRTEPKLHILTQNKDSIHNCTQLDWISKKQCLAAFLIQNIICTVFRTLEWWLEWCIIKSQFAKTTNYYCLYYKKLKMNTRLRMESLQSDEETYIIMKRNCSNCL